MSGKQRKLFAITGIFITLCIGIRKDSIALAPEIPLSQYQIYDLSDHQDFSQSTILTIIQTDDGFLWIGTPGGLFRFDGENVHRFKSRIDGLQSNRITIFSIDPQDVLWLGTMSGLTSYNRGLFKKFTTKDGLSGNDITALEHDSSGRQWIGTYNNYLTCREKNETIIYDKESGLEGKRILSLLEDHSGDIWIGTDSYGLYQFHLNSIRKPEILSKQQNFSVFDMSLDRKGAIWLATDAGLYRILKDGVNHYTIEDGLPTNSIRDVLIDSHDSIWCGTENGLVRVIQKTSGQVELESFWRTMTINCLFEDREKSLWVGTNNTGLKRLRESLFKSVSCEASMNVISLYEDKEQTIWIGSSYGLFTFRDGTLSEFHIDPLHLKNTRKPDWIRTFCEDNEGNIWVSTQSSGLLCISKKSVTNYSLQHGLPSDFIKSLAFDSKERLWVGSDKGLAVLSGSRFSSMKFTDPLLSESIYFFFEDSLQNLWIGTPFGVACVKRGEFTEEAYHFYKLGVPCLSIHEDDQGNFWVCTYGGGLCMISQEVVFYFTSHIGLKSNYLSSILEDDYGYFWLGSKEGVLRVNKNELHKVHNLLSKEITCDVFGEEDGLPSSKCSHLTRHGALKTRENEFWFATEAGIAVVNPDKTHRKFMQHPNVVIHRISVDGQDVPLNEQLSYTFGKITFHFTSPRFIDRDRLRFRYKLNNYDTDWIELLPGDDFIASYDQIPPGF